LCVFWEKDSTSHSEESSPKEQQLITLYRSLNKDYQEIIIRQAAVLKEIQKEKNENRPH
jgi:hypothetical protein